MSKIGRLLFNITLISAVSLSFLISVTAYQPGQAQAKQLRIAVSLPDLSLSFFANMAKQIQDEATQLNIQIEIMDGQNQVTKQSADMDKVISGKFDGLLISPANVDTMVAPIQTVIDAGIPVVTVDRNVNGADTFAHVGADNIKGGEAQAQLIMKRFPKGAKIFNIQGTPGATPAIERNKGLHNILDSKKEYKIVFEQTANFRRTDAPAVVEAALKANGTPDVINCANDDMALGVLDVLKTKGLNGKIVVLGYDALPETLADIKSGDITATVEQFPGGQSRKALELLVDNLLNKKSPAQHDNYLTPSVITVDNLKDAERYAELEAPATPAATLAATAAK